MSERNWKTGKKIIDNSLTNNDILGMVLTRLCILTLKYMGLNIFWPVF